ncbi:hypothetical protein AMTRI_Chr12g273510 [Amborella trichopoda]
MKPKLDQFQVSLLQRIMNMSGKRVRESWRGQEVWFLLHHQDRRPSTHRNGALNCLANLFLSKSDNFHSITSQKCTVSKNWQIYIGNYKCCLANLHRDLLLHVKEIDSIN